MGSGKDSKLFHVSATSNWEYGYNWWLYIYEYHAEQIESYSASGWGGQNIIIFPTLDLIVVTTAGYYDDPQLEFHIDILMMQKVLESALNNSAVFVEQ